MCGIVGTAGWIPTEQARRSACDLMWSRGPDGAGHWQAGNGDVWLGHRRLAIVDPSPAGSQPMAHPDRDDLVVTYNGEIYNYRSLRAQLERQGCQFRSQCDTELLLHAYHRWGPGMLDRIQGMFAFAIWDDGRRELLLARDPVGQKPLFYSHHDGRLSFASTPEAIQQLQGRRAEVSTEALAYVLTLGYVPAPLSAWRGTAQLPAGHIARWKHGGDWQTSPYWAPPTHATEAGGQDADQAFRELFSQVCEEHLLADVPVGLLLSAGLDSTSVACCLADAGRLDTTAVGVAFDDPGADESRIAAQTAAHLGLTFRRVPMPVADIDQLRREVSVAASEPQGYSALLPWYQASRAVASDYKVILSGDGADELFGGYAWYGDLRWPRSRGLGNRLFPRRPLAEAATPRQRAAAMAAFSRRSPLHRHAMRLFPRFLPEEAAQLFAPAGCGFDEQAMLAPLERHFRAELPLQDALQRVDLMGFCSGSILAKTDRMSMAHSVEVRAPFLDRRLVEWALSRPADPATAGAGKPRLRRYLAGRVPAQVLSRPKQGFSMRGMTDYDFDKLAGEVALSRLVRDRLLRPDFRRFVAPGTPYRQARLWTLAAVAAWYERQERSLQAAPAVAVGGGA